MPIIKTTSQEIKLSFIYIKDILIIGGIVGFVVLANKVLNLPILFFVLQIFIALFFSIFLCMKPKKYGHERNLKLIIRLFNMDNNTYKFQKLVERRDK